MMMEEAIERGASDIHLSAGVRPAFRLHGNIGYFDEELVTNEEIDLFLSDKLTIEQYNTLKHNLEVDCAIHVGKTTLRVNAFTQSRGLSASMRIVPSAIPPLHKLGLPSSIEKVFGYQDGLILVTGPTGSGKSTTIASILNEFNKENSYHIVTIEDPIEYTHHPIKSIINQREIGRDTKSYAAALRSTLREDPDIIFVGEMRDIESISIVLTAAETGHLVFATLHTSSAAKTIDRIIDVFPAGEKPMVRSMLSESLRAVISQALLKKVGGGRTAAHEIMVGTPAIRNLIREDKVAQMYSSIQTGQNVGMQTLDQNLQELVKRGMVSRQQAREYAKDKRLFE